jgi:acetyl-CoA acyltransferase
MVFVVDCIRTPIGKRNGSLRTLHPVPVLADILDTLTCRNDINKAEIEDVICGISSPVKEQGSNVPRLALLKAGFPFHVPGVQINRKCGSSQTAIHLLSQAIDSGDIEMGIACGVELMSVVPMGSDASYKPSLTRLSDPENRFDVGYPLLHQGISAEILAEKYDISKSEMEQYAIKSHEKCWQATQKGYFRSQIMPIKINDKWLLNDEGIRQSINYLDITTLKPSFNPTGRITAALASQISDGAAAVLLASEKKCNDLGLKKRARIVARVTVGHDPVTMLDGIITATEKVLLKSGLNLDDISVFEVNEAFASVVMCWQKTLNVPWDRINPNGGAIAHGHPLGATGAILMTKLVNELERTNSKFGLQTMCIGQGQAIATIIENCSFSE